MWSNFGRLSFLSPRVVRAGRHTWPLMLEVPSATDELERIVNEVYMTNYDVEKRTRANRRCGSGGSLSLARAEV